MSEELQQRIQKLKEHNQGFIESLERLGVSLENTAREIESLEQMLETSQECEVIRNATHD